MVVSGGDPTAVLEAVDEALDPVSIGIQVAIDLVLDATVASGGDLWRAVGPPYGVAVVAMSASVTLGSASHSAIRWAKAVLP